MSLSVEPINLFKPKQYPDIYKRPDNVIDVKSIFIEPIEKLVIGMDDKAKEALHPSDESSWIILKLFKNLKVSYKPLLLVHSFCKKDTGEFFDFNTEASDGLRILTGFIGGAVAAIAFYVFGRIISDIRIIQDDIEELHSLDCAVVDLHSDKHPHLAKIHRIAQEGIQMAERHEKRAKLSLALTICAIAFAVITVAGSILGNPIVIVAGLAGLGVMGTIELFRLGYEWYSGDDLSTLRRTSSDVRDLLDATKPVPF